MQASESAMRAAKRLMGMIADKIIASSEDGKPTFNLEEEEIATIIDEEQDGGWVKCSVRMPTKEDGDEIGRVEWLIGPITPQHRIRERWDTNPKYFVWWSRLRPLPTSPKEEQATDERNDTR